VSENEEWITQKQAAELRGVALPSITELVSRGRLRSKIVYGRRLVNRSDVENFTRAKPTKKAVKKVTKKKASKKKGGKK
jgi:excisionase family DNA binding protein